uniref:ESPR domain-containing protein n=1 Tax=Megasphaera stantonii TaxID=2144175 RepID=UPI001300A930
MNKIYKVIWSKVKHQYVVTSEFAHSCTKSTTSRAGRSAAAVLAALILTTGICAVPAQAADPTLEELYYEQLNSTVHNDETSSPVVKLVEAPTAVPTAAKDGEQAVDNDTQTGEDGGMTGAADQYTVVNEDGFYASNTKGTHNTLSKDGLWVGGKDDNTGFHVDNDGNVRTTGSVTVKSEQGDVIIQNGGVQAGNVKINTDGKNTITGLTNTTWDGTTETPDRAATEGQLGQVQGDLNELNKAAVKYDSDGQGGYTNNVTIGGQVTANSFQNTDGSFSVDANGNVDAETVKSEGMSVVDEDENTTFQVLANGDVTAHDVTATTVTGGTVIGETIRNTNNSFSVDANGNVDAETVKSEGMSVVDEDGNTTFQVLSNGDVTAHAVTATTVTGGTIQNADGSFSVDANGNVDAETVKSEGMSVVDEDGNTTFQVLANGDVTATTVTGGTVIGETIRNTNNSFSVDANGNVDAETVKSEGMSVVDEDGNTTFQVLSNGDVTAHAVTATTVTGGTIQNADGSFSVDANGNVDAETVKSEGMSVVDEDGNTTFQVLANGDVTAHDVTATTVTGGTVIGETIRNTNNSFSVDANGNVDAETVKSEGMSVVDEDGNTTFQVLSNGDVTAHAVTATTVTGGTIQNADGSFSVDANGNVDAETVKSEGMSVVDEDGNTTFQVLANGDVTAHDVIANSYSNVNGTFVADENGKVTAEKGDIGDVWLSEGNISNVKNIKAESGNIGDVKLADGKVTAQKADIGGVFIKNESIQAGNIKINENGSNEITGLSNTRWNDGTPVDEDRAATEGQLSTVQGYVDDLEKKTQHITHTATDNGHYTTIEDHTNFNSDGSIDAVDGQFRVTSDGGLMLKDEAGNETFRIYNGTGGMKAASGKFVVNGKTGEVTVDESLSVGKHDDGTYAFTVDKAGNAEVDGTMVIQGQTIINADADIKGSLGAAGNKFKVDGATGDVTANSYTTGDVRINTDGHNTITGLLNVEWSGNAEDIVADRAATEGQLLDVQGNLDTLAKGAVMYDVDEDGNVT